MEIKNIQIKNVGKFKNLDQVQDFKYGNEWKNNCNIIFGFNGCGKTTISNCLSLYASSNFVSGKEKQQIFGDIADPTDSKITINTSESEINYDQEREKPKEVFVFNHNFIASHVFDGTRANIKKFSNISAEIKNEKIQEISEKIDCLNTELANSIELKESLSTSIKAFVKTNSDRFNKVISAKGGRKLLASINLDNSSSITSGSIDTFEEEIESLSNDYALSKKSESIKADHDSLSELKFFDILLNISEIESVLQKDIKQLSKEVIEDRILKTKELIRESQDGHQEKSKVEEWFKFNQKVLAQLQKTEDSIECPVCKSDLSENISNILEDYDAYFDKKYDEFVSEISDLIDKTDSSILIYDQAVSNLNEVNKYKNRYGNIISDVGDDLTLAPNGFRQDLLNIKNCLESKKNSTNSKITISANLKTKLDQFNSSYTSVLAMRNQIVKTLSSKTYDTQKIEADLRQKFKDLSLHQFDESGDGSKLNLYHENSNKIDEIKNTKIPELKNSLQDELKKIKAESREISKYLLKMGIDNFDVDINEDKDTENITIQYKGGKKRNRLTNALSEGEKTALAFSYFLSKYHNELDTPEKQQNSVVVIDDPISSLDENRIHSTASLIFNSFLGVRQVIVFSHNFLFLKYLNNFYKGKAETFMLQEQVLMPLPAELNNFESPYFYMLKEMSNFMDDDNNQVSYSSVKNYMPNYVRRTLETFLSFKFARIRGGAKYTSPGLGEHLDHINGISLEQEIKDNITEKLEKIIKVSDSSSHGNAHQTQEIPYVSEQQLKTITKDAMWIIEQIDSTHLNSAININDSR